MQAKRKIKKKWSSEDSVQAPVISLDDVCRFCSALKIQIPNAALTIPTYTNDTIINIVLAGRLIMADPPPPASKNFYKQSKGQPPPQTLATIHGNGIQEVILLASYDGSGDLPRTGITVPMTHGHGNLTIYPTRMVEQAEDAIQLTKDLLADLGIFLGNNI